MTKIITAKNTNTNLQSYYFDVDRSDFIWWTYHKDWSVLSMKRYMMNYNRIDDAA